MIAGLELQDSGSVILEDQDITKLTTIKRQINTVFQSYTLFPHLNIFENVAFGLRSRKFANDEVKTRVEKRLEMLGLEGTFLLVIHDQSEALVYSDRLAVMHRG